jgi:hypothetical protein
MRVGGSGPVQLMQEMWALGSALQAGGASSSALVAALAAEAQAFRQEQLANEQIADAASTPEEALTRALETCRAAIGLLAQRATPQEVAAYRAWVLSVAQQVAAAARERLLGGDAISPAEQQILDQIAAALAA